MNELAGFLVGVVVGFTGVGGGALMTPILLFFFGVAPQTAVGTDLLFASVTKFAGSLVHGSRGSIDWLVLRRLCCGSLPAAALMLFILHDHRLDAGVQTAILRTLGVALALTSLSVLFKNQMHLIGRRLRIGQPERFKRFQVPLTVVAGALLGGLVTLTSVGAGALGAVMLLYLYPLRLTPAKLVGTDLAHAIPLTLIAGLGHLSLGNIDTTLLGGLLTGSIPGVLLGSWLSHRVDGAWVARAIAVLLLISGGKLLAI